VRKEEQRERTQVQAKRAKPKVGHKGAKEQIMFQERPSDKAVIRIWHCPMQQLRAGVQFQSPGLRALLHTMTMTRLPVQI